MKLNIMNSANTAVTMLRKVPFILKTKGPDICFGVGMTSMVAGTVIGCVQTAKNAKRIEVQRDALQKAYKAYKENNGTKKDIRKAATDLTKTVAKTYAWTIALEGAGLALASKGYSIRKNDAIALSGKLASTVAIYDAYRKRIKEAYGEDADKIGLGVETKEKEVTEVDKKTGEVKTQKAKVEDWTSAKDLYLVKFNKNCRGYERDRYVSISYLEGLQTYYTAKLHANGYLWLSTILEEIGLEPSAEQRNVGWLYDKEDMTGRYGDSFVDFGLDANDIAVRQWMNGYTEELPLTFNCVGDIRYGYERLRKGGNVI